MANTFEFKLRLLKINKRGYTEALQKAVDTQVRQAAREWLRTVMIHVPVYSGQAAASLVPLGRHLHVAIPIHPDPVARRRYPGGISIGESQGTFSFSSEGWVSTFTFSTEVPHYLINEFNAGLGSPPLRHPTPWASMEHGRNAFMAYLQENLKSRIPKITDYITGEDV
jgi:hypothetical protein